MAKQKKQDDNVEKQDKTKEPLWCEKCQRGISGVPDNDRYDEGDLCPMCLTKYSRFENKEYFCGVLKKISTVRAEKAKRAELIKLERERNKVRGIKGSDELVREAESRMLNKVKDQEQKIVKLEALVQELADKGRDPRVPKLRDGSPY